MELLTAARMRVIEQAAIARGSTSGLCLMERAGQGVVEAVFAWRPELAESPHYAVVLCGPGNNGGDGFVVARLLNARGWTVEVFFYGDPAKLPADAAENHRRWSALGAVRPFAPTTVAQAKADLFVDALFGTGLSRPLPNALTEALAGAHASDRTAQKRVAVDAPSGLCLDSGRILGPAGATAVNAALTVTFHRPKIGHYLNEGPGCCGALRVVDLGLAAESRADRPGLATPQGTLGKARIGHKYQHGHALILSGGVGKGGAARLAARGALRIGAGLVTLGCPPAALIENAARLDAIMLRPIPDTDALSHALMDRRIAALCLGPGLGLPRARALVPVATRAERATLLDADALTAFEDAPEALFAHLHSRCILTPHLGEFGRLFPDLKAKLDEPALKGPAYAKLDAVREAAARAGCVVLIKGADTVIAAPDGRARISSACYERAAPWLATAGSGDVLAGFITGLLARGFTPLDASETAAWMHIACALHFGPGLIAEDIPEQLPAVLRSLDV
ncbi:MAG: NAD(P)H-hydrate dehydratase [Pseudomonadota bacterium]